MMNFNALNLKLRGKIDIESKIRLVKMNALLLSQFSLLSALDFQLVEMVTCYKMMEHKINLSLAVYMSARKSYLHR